MLRHPLCAGQVTIERTSSAVVLELWGENRQFDLVASRKLTLAAQSSGVTGLMLRMAAQPLPSTAETRWMLRAAHSPPGAMCSAWGAPRFDAARHDQCIRCRRLGTARLYR